jgi:hypothetical protein
MSPLLISGQRRSSSAAPSRGRRQLRGRDDQVGSDVAEPPGGSGVGGT